MKKIANEFENSWANLKDERELEIFQKFAETGKVMNLLYSCN